MAQSARSTEDYSGIEARGILLGVLFLYEGNIQAGIFCPGEIRGVFGWGPRS